MSGDRKATEDLLAGFDRTGRTPRAPPVRPIDPRRGMETVALRPTSRTIWPWIAIGVVFAITVAVVLSLVLPQKNVALPATVTVPAVSAPASAAPVIVVDIAPVVSAPIPASAAPPPPRSASAPAPPPKATADHRVDFVPTL